ncbi:GntR family transcriptional regulator [Roseibium sp. RKSG952]|uniref:GntR family transcriptional regulator n=1 Tax=Roseibium sp. RKSG952 TaxID=2529384 RepID=UPI0012BCA49E|nr:GntR family transcriptional regulator [Roseibium sp. RKSG952]MTH97439.1 GntR family transcriptional regulator [Roseibium sp. RKSG952]
MSLQLVDLSETPVSGAPQKPARRAHAIYMSLQERILTGDLTPESPLTEQALAQEFGCSQGTIREALLSLREDGLVVRQGYQGTFVTRTNNTEAIVLLRLRRDIELAAVERLIERARPGDIKDLRLLAQAYDTARQNRQIYATSQADLALHMAMSELAGIPILAPILRRTILQLHRFIITRHLNDLNWLGHIDASHQAILDAIADKDRERARHLAAQHVISNTIQIKREIQEKVFAPVSREMPERVE